MTSGGYRNPANADTGGDHARVRADFTDQVSLDLANAQRNGAKLGPAQTHALPRQSPLVPTLGRLNWHESGTGIGTCLLCSIGLGMDRSERSITPTCWADVVAGA